MNTVNMDVITFAQLIGCGTFGVDLFYGRVPNSNKVPTSVWWLVPDTASVLGHNVTGEDTLSYRYSLAYRDMSLKKVDDELFRVTKEIVGSHCYELDNYRTMNVELVSAAPHIDVDDENRVYGTVDFKVTVYNILKPKTESD